MRASKPSKPSKVFSQMLRVLLLTVPILATLAGTILLVTLPLAWWSGSGVIQPGHLLVGVVCGLVVWLFLSVFHLKAETITLPFQDRTDFVQQLLAQLQELGYEVRQPNADQIVSWPAFRSLLFGGHLLVQVRSGEAQIRGPKLYLEILRQRLRLEQQVARLQRKLSGPRKRSGDRLLKRVQISLRFSPDRWDLVAEKIVNVLRLRGADVLCDLHLLAASDQGVSEQLIDGPVRDWLQQHALQSQIHKDLAQWEEPSWRHTMAVNQEGDTPLCQPAHNSSR